MGVVMKTDSLVITPEILRLISEIDEFMACVFSKKLKSAKRLATKKG